MIGLVRWMCWRERRGDWGWLVQLRVKLETVGQRERGDDSTAPIAALIAATIAARIAALSAAYPEAETLSLTEVVIYEK